MNMTTNNYNSLDLSDELINKLSFFQTVEEIGIYRIPSVDTKTNEFITCDCDNSDLDEILKGEINKLTVTRIEHLSKNQSKLKTRKITLTDVEGKSYKQLILLITNPTKESNFLVSQVYELQISGNQKDSLILKLIEDPNVTN